MKVLLLDNYDSFVYNLLDYVGKMGAEAMVLRSNRATVEMIESLNPDRIIISPGPGHPSQRRFVGVSPEVLTTLSKSVPTLGVCLGHQLIAYVFGGRVRRAGRIMHGKTSMIEHMGEGIFRGVENPLEATRYHSLIVDERTLPESLEITARSMDDGEVMALRHRSYPIVGVQFHPESILTREGIKILRNFLEGEI